MHRPWSGRWAAVLLVCWQALSCGIASANGPLLVQAPVVPSVANPAETPAEEHVSVERLEKLIAPSYLTPGQLEQHLSGVVLTERLSDARLAKLQAQLSSATSKQLLSAVADASAFLDPPNRDVSAAPPPDITEQHKIQALAVEYLAKAIPKLPDLFATQSTLLFQRVPLPHHKTDQIWQLMGTSKATVLYRRGREVEESIMQRGGNGLVTRGVFGPILGIAMADASQNFIWGYWEPTETESLAVFRYTVPLQTSHWEVTCHLSADESTSGLTAYNAEVAIDPATGIIRRIMMKAQLNPSLPCRRADVMVEYGPIQIAGKTYICPLKSVSFSEQTSTATISGHRGIREVTSLNDVVFRDYHVFRADHHMLPGYTPIR